MQAREINHRALIALELLLWKNAKLLKKRAIANYMVIGGEVIGNLLSRLITDKHFGNLVNYLLEKVEITYLDAPASKTLGDVEKDLEKYGYRIVGIEKEESSDTFPCIG